MTERLKLSFAPVVPPLELLPVKQPSSPAEMLAAFIGPPGPVGTGYLHTQATPLAVWTVAHNLGRRPSITVADHLGHVVVPDIQYLSNDVIQVSHSSPMAGFAYIN